MCLKCASIFLQIIEILSFSMDITGAQPFYSGHVVDEDGRGALVFVNEAVLGTFVDAEELHIDGTFKTVPLPFYQVVPVLFIRFDKVCVSFFNFSSNSIMFLHYLLGVCIRLASDGVQVFKPLQTWSAKSKRGLPAHRWASSRAKNGHFRLRARHSSSGGGSFSNSTDSRLLVSQRKCKFKKFSSFIHAIDTESVQY